MAIQADMIRLAHDEDTASGKTEPITLKHVADALDMSPSTVSRAFTRPGMLREDTRTRVLEAAERLGYFPNLNARGLRLQRTGLVCVVVPSLSPFFLEIFRGAEEAALAEGYTILMGHTNRDLERERHFFDQAASRRADGILLIANATAADLARHLSRRVPTVLALEACPELQIPSVHVDHVAGAMAATRHVIALGHRRIGHIAGPDASTIARHRREGFVRALAEAGLQHEPQLIASGGFDPASGEEAMRQLLELPQPPTAIFAANDEMAVGAIRAARGMGHSVPDDLSVIGFDDQRIAGLYEPGVTTIRIPTSDIGFQAMKRLSGLIDGQSPEHSLLLPTCLVERASTAPPPDTGSRKPSRKRL